MKIKRILPLLLAAAVLLAGCGKDKGDKDPDSGKQPEQKEYPVSIGDSVRLSEKPSKVVSISPALTEIIYELGYQDQLVGVSDYCDYPEQAKSLDKCGTPQAINFSQIEALSPKLLVTSTPLIEGELKKLQQMDIEVLTLPRASNLKELKTIYTDLARAMGGEITGKEDGENLFGTLDDFLGKIDQSTKAVLASGAKRQSVIMLRMPDFIMATGDTFEQSLLEKLNVDNLAKPYGEWVYPKDEAANLTMNYIIADSSITIPMLEKNETYKKTQAVIKDKVVNIDFTAFERQSPRMMAEMQKIADFIYPSAEGESGPSSAGE